MIPLILEMMTASSGCFVLSFMKQQFKHTRNESVRLLCWWEYTVEKTSTKYVLEKNIKWMKQNVRWLKVLFVWKADFWVSFLTRQIPTLWVFPAHQYWCIGIDTDPSYIPKVYPTWWLGNESQTSEFLRIWPLKYKMTIVRFPPDPSSSFHVFLE